MQVPHVSKHRLMSFTAARHTLPKQAKLQHTGEVDTNTAKTDTDTATATGDTDTAAAAAAAAAVVGPGRTGTESAIVLLNAQPNCGVTMRSADHGAVVRKQGLDQPVNVLVDIGPSHNVCRLGLMQLDSDSTVRYEVSVPSSTEELNAKSGALDLRVQDTGMHISACEMGPPLGVDVLLGQAWQVLHQATILTWQGQVNFIDMNNAAIWQKP